MRSPRSAYATRKLIASSRSSPNAAGGHKTVWHGHAPYNPVIAEKYLTIFRTVNNFILAGDDGDTPAMRLGFTKQPLAYEDIVWPGQRVPRPKRTRRRGKKMVAA